jgi:hypothetical protein
VKRAGQQLLLAVNIVAVNIVAVMQYEMYISNDNKPKDQMLVESYQ